MTLDPAAPHYEKDCLAHRRYKTQTGSRRLSWSLVMHTINEDIFKITFLPLMFSSSLKYQSAVYFNYFSISIERKLTIFIFYTAKV